MVARELEDPAQEEPENPGLAGRVPLSAGQRSHCPPLPFLALSLRFQLPPFSLPRPLSRAHGNCQDVSPDTCTGQFIFSGVVDSDGDKL